MVWCHYMYILMTYSKTVVSPVHQQYSYQSCAKHFSYVSWYSIRRLSQAMQTRNFNLIKLNISVWSSELELHQCLPNTKKHLRVDGLEQDCSNSIANAVELLQSCTEPSMYKNDHNCVSQTFTYEDLSATCRYLGMDITHNTVIVISYPFPRYQYKDAILPV